MWIYKRWQDGGKNISFSRLKLYVWLILVIRDVLNQGGGVVSVGIKVAESTSTF